MPIQKVKFGDKTISSDELSWEQIKRMSAILRKFARWNPEEKIWTVTWRIFSKINEIRSLLKNVKDLDESYIEEIEKVIEEINSVENVKLIDGKIAILVKDIDPYDFVKKFGGKIKFIRRKYSFGELETPYIMISKDKVKFLPEQLKFVIRNFIEKEKRKARLSILSVKRIMIKFGDIPPIGLIHQLKNLGTIRYYYEDFEGTTILKEQLFYKEKIEDNQYIIYLPSYAFSFALSIIKKYGYAVDSNIKIKNSIDIDLRKNFELFEHQKEAYHKWINYGYKGTVVIPTGGGKTHIALQAIYDLKAPTIIFVPNTMLLTQWIEKISKFLGVPKGLVGVLGKGEKKIRDITVATYQSGYKNIDILWDKFSFVVFDEAHHIPAQTFKRVALYLPAPYRLALSATPKRRDKNEILLFKLVGDVVYKVEYRDLVIKGIVAPLAVRRIFVPLPADLLIQYNAVQRELYRAKNPIEKKKVVNKLIAIARDNPVKIEVIKEIIKRNRDEKIFIFAGSIDFAEKIAEKNYEVAGKEILKMIIEKLKRKLVRIDHVKLDGKIARLTPGKLISVDETNERLQLTIKREIKGEGIYDGLKIPRKPGDYDLMIVQTERWFIIHRYFSAKGELKGEYYNINTPPEITENGIRYIDLYIDVIRRPNGEIEIIDEDQLKRAYESGRITRQTYERALTIASELLEGKID